MPERAGLRVVAFAGTRIVNDYLAEHLKTEETQDTSSSWSWPSASATPYRRVAPFLQLIGRS